MMFNLIKNISILKKVDIDKNNDIIIIYIL
jgi:hypothetical protein